MRTPSTQQMLEREAVANRPKHWVRLVTACNSACLFCLDADTPRNVYLPREEIHAELDLGRAKLDAWKVILSGGEASLHPEYPEIIAYARQAGYGRIQTVTNGWRYADRDFYERCVAAGLQEITFSLHGHTEELHDHMTQHPGSFKRIVRAIARSARDRRMITSIDVCINKQNVGYLDKIVELGIRLGVTEYDLLHVIPQANAYDNRDDLFYDPREHLETLHKVFRLNRHPRFVIWTNRFPVEFLEGLEDLIQDPHKMIDEVNGRRFQVRRYLDLGEPLSCREPDRCKHCFIESFCTTMDRVIARQRTAGWQVWWVGDALGAGELPFGCDLLGVEVAEVADLDAVDLPQGVGLYARVGGADVVTGLRDDVPIVLAVTTSEQLEALRLDGVPAHVRLEVELSRATGPWIEAHADWLVGLGEQGWVHQPTHEHMSEAVDQDVRDPASLFRRIGPRLRVSGLPACLAPGTELVEPTHLLRSDLFVASTGRLDIDQLARHHIATGYTAKSVRCRDCRVRERCDGAHVNLLRDQGLGLLEPLVDGAWADDAERQLVARVPHGHHRLANGRQAEGVAPSLPGHDTPTDAVRDPLAVLAVEIEQRRRRRREELRKRAAAELAGGGS